MTLKTIAAAWGAAALFFLLGYMVGHRFALYNAKLSSQEPGQQERGKDAGDRAGEDP